ncbi:MAG: hypothetical protein U0Y68_09890 [Blastocatellia bacterium]
MGSPIANVIAVSLPSLSANPQAASPTGQSNFAQVLRQATKDASPQTTAPKNETKAAAEKTPLNEPSGTSGTKLEQLHVDLMRNLDRSPADATSLNAMLPKLLTDQSRTGLLREAMRGVVGRREALDLTNRFGKVETEWNQIERLMNSDQSLSNGELIGLQARLYQVTQHIEVLSKVVDQMNSGVKTILNTNV